MAEKIEIAKLDIDTAALTTKNAQLLGQITSLKDAQKGLRKETDNLNSASNDQLKTYAKTDAELKQLNTEYNQQKTVLAETTTGVNNLSIALNKEVKSVKDAQKNNSKLIKLRNQLNVKTKEGQKAIAQINTKIDQNNKVIKKNSSALEKQRLNIGNYTSALDKVVPGLGGFINGLTGVTKTMKGTNLGLKAFRIALIATGIGAIVVLLGLLVGGFASTQGGMDKINESLAPLKGAFQALIGVVQDLAVNVFGQLKDRFTIASNSIQIGIGKMRILWNKLSGDTEEANELIKTQKALVDESAAAQERINTKMEAFNKIVDGANARLEKGAEVQSRIHGFTVAIERLQIDTTLAIAKSRLEYEKQRSIAQDQTKTDQERVDALNEAEKAQLFISGTAKKILDLQIQQLVLSQSLNDTDRAGEQELADLKARSFEADQAAQRKINSLVALRSGILKKQATQAVKAAEEELKLAAKLEEERAKLILSNEERIADKIAMGKAILFREALNQAEEEGVGKLAIKLLNINEEERLAKQQANDTIKNKILLERELALIEEEYRGQRAEAVDLSEQDILDGKLAKIQEYANEVGSLLSGLAQNSLERAKIDAQQDIDIVNKKFEARFEAAGKDQAEIIRLEKQKEKELRIIDDRKREHERKNAIFQKALALTQAAISTALAVIKVAPVVPLMLATAAFGAAQIGVIASKPIPKFATGTKRVLGDGTETSDSVHAMLSKNERIVDAKNNRKIGFDLSNDQLATAAQMYRSFNLNGGISMNNTGMIEAINKNTRAIKGKPVSRTTISLSESYRITNKTKYLT